MPVSHRRFQEGAASCLHFGSKITPLLYLNKNNVFGLYSHTQKKKTVNQTIGFNAESE